MGNQVNSWRLGAYNLIRNTVADMRLKLWTILLSLVVIGASVAAFGPYGLAVGATLLGVASYLRGSKSAGGVYRRLGCLMAFAIVAFFPLTALINALRETDPHGSCSNRLSHIGMALANYEAMHRSYPPAYVADANGKPMYSWRVLILPFLECQQLYADYRKQESWDGPHNSKLTGNYAPSAYRCVGKRGADASASHCTDYVAVIGPHGAWHGHEPAKYKDFEDNRDEVLFAVEIPHSDISWSEPRDVTFEEAVQRIAAGRTTKHDVLDRGYFYHSQPVFRFRALYGSGRVRTFPADREPEEIRAMLLRGGVEEIDLDGPAPSRLRWDRIISVAVLVLSCVVFLFRRRAKNTSPETPAVP